MPPSEEPTSKSLQIQCQAIFGAINKNGDLVLQDAAKLSIVAVMASCNLCRSPQRQGRSRC